MKKILLFVALVVALLSICACSKSKSVEIADIAVYPDAVELDPGGNTIADSLVNNMEQDAALRQSIGIGGDVEQKGFALPKDATWDQVKAFYEKELKDAGWSSGLGGVAGEFVDVNDLMATANTGNDLFQTLMWSKDKQNLSLVMVTDPTDSSQKVLLLSLSTQ